MFGMDRRRTQKTGTRKGSDLMECKTCDKYTGNYSNKCDKCISERIINFFTEIGIQILIIKNEKEEL
jgi:hypothetical protein